MAAMENTLAQLGLPAPENAVIAGDWHGNTRWMRQALRCASRDGYTFLIHVGDLKALWYDEYPDFPERGSFTAELAHELEDLGMVLVFADGNHDVHPKLRNLPLNADGFGVISDRLLYAPRGQRWTLGGVRFGTLGGAYSIDRWRGSKGRDWFEEEVTTAEDVEALGADPLDVLITHDVPAGINVVSVMDIPEALERESYIVRSLLRDAVRATSPKLVFSGHWHQRGTSLMPGMDTRVHVLDMEFRPGNLVTVDLDTLRVEDYEPA